MAYDHKHKESNEAFTLLLGTKKTCSLSVREELSFATVAKTEDTRGEERDARKGYMV